MYVPSRPGFNSLGIDKTYRPNVKGHMVIYRQNGGGRDTYIMGNNGGFCIQEGSKKFQGYQNDFKDSLRKYERIDPKRSNSNPRVQSGSPVRYKTLTNSFATTLNRFKVYMKRGQSQDSEGNITPLGKHAYSSSINTPAGSGEKANDLLIPN